jgi:lysophospholipase L1-like esterase
MNNIAKILLAFALCAIAAPAVHAQDAPVGGISWTVQDRFRFFSEEAFFAPHEKAAQAFAAIDAPRDEFGRKKIKGEWVGPVQFAERRLAASAIKNGHDGWAAQAYTSSKEPFTCWASGLRRVRGDCLKPEDDKGARLFPTQVTITTSLSGAATQIFAGKQCEWFIHTGADKDWRTVTQVDCAVAAQLTAPVNEKFSLLARVLDPASPNGVLTQLSAVYQEVQGRLVVGFGDSYGAGEGNPDYPANYSKPTTLADTLRPQPSTLPRWLDPACHRSVYSHQQRVAMQLAAENPRSVISYAGYACSGANITNIVDATDNEADHVESLSKVGLRDNGVRKGINTVLAQAGWSQLDHAVRDLCADEGAATASRRIKLCSNWRRQPDLILLSVGGNDIGFSNVVKWAVAGTTVGQVRYLSGGEKPGTMLARASGEQELAGCEDKAGYQCNLAARYASLAVAFENRLGILDRSKVITGPYPGPMGDETGVICKAQKVNEGADSEHFIATSDKRLQSLHQTLFAGKDLTNAMKTAVAKTGWTWVDALAWSGAFDRHGVCARGDRPSDALKTIQNINGEWQPVSPADMLAYAPRQRWFRTFNDSVLMQFYVTRVEQLSRNPRQPIDYHYQAGVSGYFHPTAEGQAVMADMLLNAARCKLFGKGGC